MWRRTWSSPALAKSSNTSCSENSADERIPSTHSGPNSELNDSGWACVFIYNNYRSRIRRTLPSLNEDHLANNRTPKGGARLLWPGSNRVLVSYCRSEEPVHVTNMDITTGHMILVSQKISFSNSTNHIKDLKGNHL